MLNGLLNMEHFIFLLNAPSRKDVPVYLPKLAAIFHSNSICFEAKLYLDFSHHSLEMLKSKI